MGGHLHTRPIAVTRLINDTNQRLMRLILGAIHNMLSVSRYHFTRRSTIWYLVHFNAGSLHRTPGWMVNWNDNMERGFDTSRTPLPVSRCYTQSAHLPSARTVTGKRSSLYCCLDFGEDLHLSLTGSCLLASFELRPHSPLPLLLLLPSQFAASSESMPRLRHRMRCRRGSSRNQSRRPPSTPSTSSDPPSHSDSHHSPHSDRILHSGRRIHSTNPMPPPTHTQTASFSYNSSLNRPRVTASITVVFQEEPQATARGSDQANQDISEAQSAEMHGGIRHTVSMDMQEMDGKATQDQARQDFSGQPCE